jgi:hypothetical protein
MGEKGNITSDELVAGVASTLTAAGETIRDKVIDKTIDTGIDSATERMRKDPDEQTEV